MLDVIWGDNTDLLDQISKEFVGAYSKHLDSFLITDEEYQKVEQKYHFKSNDYDCEDEQTGGILVSDLDDYLLMTWEDKTIPISISFVYPETIEINMYENIEIALQPYTDENDLDQKDNLVKLFQSKDWYKTIYNYAAHTMLQLVLDDTTIEIKSQMRELDKEFEEDE